MTADAPTTTQAPGPLWILIRMLSRLYTTLAFDLKIYHAEFIPRTGGVLLVSNHQSYLDPVLLAVKLKRPMSYLARADLFERPLFAWLIRGLNAFPIKRGRGDKGAIEETVRRLGEGYLLNVFPEGTRTVDGEIQPLQRGVALLVRRAAVPIIPAVIEGSYQAWPKGRKWPRARKIRILYGPAIDVENLKADVLIERIERTLREMHERLRRQMREEGVAR